MASPSVVPMTPACIVDWVIHYSSSILSHLSSKRNEAWRRYLLTFSEIFSGFLDNLSSSSCIRSSCGTSDARFDAPYEKVCRQCLGNLATTAKRHATFHQKGDPPNDQTGEAIPIDADENSSSRPIGAKR